MPSVKKAVYSVAELTDEVQFGVKISCGYPHFSLVARGFSQHGATSVLVYLVHEESPKKTGRCWTIFFLPRKATGSHVKISPPLVIKITPLQNKWRAHRRASHAYIGSVGSVRSRSLAEEPARFDDKLPRSRRCIRVHTSTSQCGSAAERSDETCECLQVSAYMLQVTTYINQVPTDILSEIEARISATSACKVTPVFLMVGTPSKARD